jgi:hypothetical protein
MKKARFLLPALISASCSAYANPPIVLNDATLDAVTAGAASSVAAAYAFASGPTNAAAKTSVLTYAKALQPNVWQTGSKVTAVAQSNGLAFTAGTSTSTAGTTGVSVGGSAIAVSDEAFARTSIRAKAIDTPHAEIAIGIVRSVACCGPDTDTSVQASTFTEQNFNASRIVLKEVKTPRLSMSVAIAVIVSLSHL